MLITFDEALATEPDRSRRHLLLGNGFSIACRPDIFTYGALLERADFRGLDAEVRQAFDALGTSSFEVVMKGLRAAGSLLKVYAPGSTVLVNRVHTHADQLREVLVKSIAESHPAHPFEIDDTGYGAARQFLSNFVSIYTLSYDLLLYWALMRGELPGDVPVDDGFRMPPDGPAQYVTWEVENTSKQDVHYLHGALHLFDAGHELKKLAQSGFFNGWEEGRGREIEGARSLP